jgi:hypothetical protein
VEVDQHSVEGGMEEVASCRACRQGLPSHNVVVVGDKDTS